MAIDQLNSTSQDSATVRQKTDPKMTVLKTSSFSIQQQKSQYMLSSKCTMGMHKTNENVAIKKKKKMHFHRLTHQKEIYV